MDQYKDYMSIEYRTKNGTIAISKDLYAPHDSIKFSATSSMSVALPLGRHLRKLVDLFGHEAITKHLNNLPK